jgi:hypothetical protein
MDLLLLEESQKSSRLETLQISFPGRQTTVDGFRKNLELQGQDSVSDWPRGGYGLLWPAEKVGFASSIFETPLWWKPHMFTSSKRHAAAVGEIVNLGKDGRMKRPS